jgi:hypothetical protein
VAARFQHGWIKTFALALLCARRPDERGSEAKVFATDF